MNVAFAVVPFANLSRPAIGVSLLKAGLRDRGFDSKVFYFNIVFAEIFGETLFTFISDQTPSDSMAGEWFFADLVFADQLPPDHEFIRNFFGRGTPPDLLKQIMDARKRLGEFVEVCAQTLRATEVPIVGFTTTFHQTCACLAIAKRLKELPHSPTIVFGGANCEGEMGRQMIRSFPWIDYVCTREGDVVFPEFVTRFLGQGDRRGLPGLLSREEKAELSYPEIVEDMDSLPIPDYDDYVDAVKNSSFDGIINREMQIEAARGCWWGAKYHCTFCGLNGDTMRYRSKSPERVYEELKSLYNKYGVHRIDSVDNILDHRYITSVFPRLRSEGIELEMFYEVKANLKFWQLEAMYRGGIKYIQPGIESFSTPILKLMRKGVTGVQNLQLLKWSEEIGIRPSWNILAGFPGESAADYDRLAELIPLLTHLEPPTGCAAVRLDRFSPLFTQSEEFGLTRVRPTAAYYYIFPLGRRELARLAYFFDFEYADGRDPESYIVAAQREIQKWRAQRFEGAEASRPRLDAFIAENGTVLVTDTRKCATATEHWLAGLETELLLAMDGAQSLQMLKRRFAADGMARSLDNAVRSLLEARLVVEMDQHILSLPILRNRPPHMRENEPDAHRRIPTAANPEPLLRVL